MLTHLRFKNIKAWKDSGEIRLAPITVFFGANSAGKTTIPQLLLLLKQTAESPDRQQTLQLGDNRTLVDLGTYEDLVHNHDVGAPVEFALEWELDSSLEVVDPLSEQKYSGNRLGFNCVLRANESRQPVVDSFRYLLKENGVDQLDLELKRSGKVRQRKEKKPEFELKAKPYILKRQAGRAWPIPSPTRFYGFPDETTAYYQNATFAADLVLELERALKRIFHVGPLREYPKRLYLWSGEKPDHVGARGGHAVEAILAGGDRKLNFAAGKKQTLLPALVAERLKMMGLIADFKVEALGQHRKEYEVLVKTNPNLPEVKLTDVGFGVSQVLPVIVECFYVPARSIVLFEQPEIHLHPRVQADLADLFVDAIHAREGGSPRGCQFIIESHSEHFLRRLQRRIAEEKLKPEDTALYFVRADGQAARVEELEVDPFGNILNWPEGFFGDEMDDLVARVEAQERRTKRR